MMTGGFDISGLALVAGLCWMLMAWPLIIRRFFSERQFADLMAGDQANLHRRSPDAGLTGLGWLLFAHAMMSVAILIPQLIVPPAEMSRGMARAMSMLGSAGAHSLWWSAGLIALQAWAGFELVRMSSTHRAIGTIYAIVAIVIRRLPHLAGAPGAEALRCDGPAGDHHVHPDGAPARDPHGDAGPRQPQHRPDGPRQVPSTCTGADSSPRMTRVVTLLLLGAVLTGCQDDVTTPFPPGLEPLEDNPVAPDGDLTVEQLHTMPGSGGGVRVYGRGYVLAPPSHLWELTKQPLAMVAMCSTDEQHVTEANQPDYEYSFLVHYVVHNILTVEWDDQWRYGVILGTIDDVILGMIKHQKTQGSDFITVSEGTVQVLSTDDPEVSELAFVEHLDAISGGVADVTKGMQHNYDALVALAHGAPIPGCP